MPYFRLAPFIALRCLYTVSAIIIVIVNTYIIAARQNVAFVLAVGLADHACYYNIVLYSSAPFSGGREVVLTVSSISRQYEYDTLECRICRVDGSRRQVSSRNLCRVKSQCELSTFSCCSAYRYEL